MTRLRGTAKAYKKPVSPAALTQHRSDAPIAQLGCKLGEHLSVEPSLHSHTQGDLVNPRLHLAEAGTNCRQF